MKYRNKKWKRFLTKGLAFSLLFTTIGGLIPPLPVKAADPMVAITGDITERYYNHVNSNKYPSDEVWNPEERMELFSQFLSSRNSAIPSISSDDFDDYETDEVVWNPSQSQVNENRDLYFLQWTNGDNYTNPGDGYEILSRIVYITKSGQIRFSEEDNLDYYPRQDEFLDLGLTEQWDNNRVNQCTFAVPDDCAQIVGLYMGNESGGGDNNDRWTFSSLNIYRISSDNVNDIVPREKNGLGHNQCHFKNGQLVAFVSAHDIAKEYLGTNDEAEEWLYLLQSAEPDTPTTSSGYYAQIVTGNSDLSGKDLTLEITYTDPTGRDHTYKQTVNDSTLGSFYPELTFAENFDTKNFEDVYLLRDFRNIIGLVNKANAFNIESYKLGYHTTYSNSIAMEIPKKDTASTSRSITSVLKSYGDFYSYDWDTSNTTLTNLYAFTLFGNYVDYSAMQADLLGPNTATDIRLDITNHVAAIKEIKIYQKSGTGEGVLQDVRIYCSSPDKYTRTRMNGGISSERVFYDVNDAYCLASLDQSKPIQLSGNGVVTCSLNPTKGNLREHLLLQHTEKTMSLMAEDDNLGFQISLADVYTAGLDIFMAKLQNDSERLNENFWKWNGPDPEDDNFYRMSDIRTYILERLPDQSKLVDKVTALEILNLVDNYYKEGLTLTIRYKDDFGSVREVEVPFITSYLMQIYSDNDGRLGNSKETLLTGIFQQGDDAGLRIPLSQYSELVDITLSLGKSPLGVTNIKSNKYYYYNDPTIIYEGSHMGIKTYGSWDHMWKLLPISYNISYLDDMDVYPDYMQTLLSRELVAKLLGAEENIISGRSFPNSATFSARAFRVYEHVTKNDFRTTYDPNQRVTRLSTTKDCTYYYQSKDKNGTSFAVGSRLTLSPNEGTLIRGVVDFTEVDMQNMYLVEIKTEGIFGSDSTTKDLELTLAYTNTSGQQVQVVTAKRLSELARNYFGDTNLEGVSMKLNDKVDYGHEAQTRDALRSGYGYFTIELSDVSQFDYIYITLPGGSNQSVQINNVSIYKLYTLGQRYSSPRDCVKIPMFVRDFTGVKVAFNNKPIMLSANKDGATFNFSIITSDGTVQTPTTDSTYDGEYLIAPPTTMAYEDTLKNLGLAVTKYTYTVNVTVANVLDAGSSNYFYFQLVFENGTSGVVLANQQLASDSFRQGYTESFVINTTQNYGEVSAVRVICDTASSTSQVFDKLNIESITVTLPNQGSAKSWIVDTVGWIDINYQDEGVATTVSEDRTNGGFPNSEVVKEFAKTRTASTARLLFSVSTGWPDTYYIPMPYYGSFEGTLTYEDSFGELKTYNFDLRNAVYNFIENSSHYLIFRPTKSDYFSLEINDIASVKSLSIYRSGGSYNWMIQGVSVYQFTEMGELYKDSSGEYKRYMEGETLLATSFNSNVLVQPMGNATFSFTDNSILMNTAGTDPALWTTTVTRIPATTEETLNVYLYAGSDEERSYSFSTENLLDMKGRTEYTLKDGGTSIGSTAFTFTHYGTINGTTVLKASDISVTGMNQLKTLHLETASTDTPIISGAIVERIRGNTIVETQYFNFGNASMNAGHNYSAVANADTFSSPTKQTLALQLSSGQKQLFTSNSDIAVALLYTSENSSSETPKMVYSSPNIFFTEAGITSLGNSSILEIPFEIAGADEIVGISIVSNGPNVSFVNAVATNYVEDAGGDKTILDTCQLAQQFETSTVKQTLLKDDSSNVTSITLTFITSADSDFSGAGTSGRLPLTIHYKTLTGEDETLDVENFANLLPTNLLPSAGSRVSFKVHLSNFSELTAIDLNAPNDDWHLKKIIAEISDITYTTPQQREAIVDSWITSRAPVTAVFSNGNDSENAMNQIVNFSVTGNTETFGNVETATSGNALMIEAIPGERVTFTPLVTTSGTPENTIIWDTSQYGDYMSNAGNDGLTFRVPDDSVGEIYSFTTYCSFDSQKVITITIKVVDAASTTGGAADDTNDSTNAPDEVSVDAEIHISGKQGPDLPTFSARDGKNQTYTISIKSGEYTGTWSFEGSAEAEGCNVTFTPATVVITNNAGKQTTTMICTDKNGTELFRVTFEMVVS